MWGGGGGYRKAFHSQLLQNCLRRRTDRCIANIEILGITNMYLMTVINIFSLQIDDVMTTLSDLKMKKLGEH